MRAKAVSQASPRWVSCLPDTPLGPLSLTFTPSGLASLAFAVEGDPRAFNSCSRTASSSHLPQPIATWMELAKEELAHYFAAITTRFPSLPLNPLGPPFQLRVWQELRQIPSGDTISYQELARRLGNPKASRAVGQALGANPIPIIIPCHRVIRADCSLGGYSSGLERKRWLLRHEGWLKED